MSSISENLSTIVSSLEAARANILEIPGLSQTRERVLMQQTGGALGAARSATLEVAELENRVTRTIDVDASVENLRELQAKEEKDAAKQTGSTSAMLEWAVSVKLAEKYEHLANNLEACKGQAGNQPMVEDENGRRSRKISPEEALEWWVEEAQKSVFDWAYRQLSMSTSTSSNMNTAAEACASAMFLASVGGTPNRHWAYHGDAIRWNTEVND